MNNPAFKNVGRPAYELPNLLKALGVIDAPGPMTAVQRDLASAAEIHATNALSTLLDGIDVIGSLMTQIGAAGDDLRNGDLCKIGVLITHLAVEAQLMVDVQSDMETILRQDTELSMKGAAK